MRLISVCCVLLALVVSCTAQSGHPLAPRYAVDLDAPAKERWVDVIANFKDQYGPIQAWINTLISPALQSFLEPYLEDIDTLLPGEFGAELIGVAQGSGMHLGEIVVLNLIYDLTAFCTSIVAQSNNGSIYHARNLDYDIPGLRNITVQIDFQKGGVTQYSCTTFAGYVGCLTGVRPGGFSITIDERDVPGESILDNILAIFHGGQSIGFFVRDTLANQTDFSSAITVLADDYLIAPCYIIVGGVNPGEGAVITRNRSHAIDVWRIDFPQRWWLVETNYDHWLAPPPNDDRRDPANKAMAAIGSAAITPEGMFNVLSIPPVLNDGTQYTTMMMAATGFMESHIRLDTPPMSTADLMARRLQRKYQQVV